MSSFTSHPFLGGGQPVPALGHLSTVVGVVHSKLTQVTLGKHAAERSSLARGTPCTRGQDGVKQGGGRIQHGAETAGRDYKR